MINVENVSFTVISGHYTQKGQFLKLIKKHFNNCE
jgi:hypothetical protein